METKQKNLNNVESDIEYVLKMQPIAIQTFYNSVWPDWDVVELDNDKADTLKHIIDVGGADKMLRSRNGRIAFLAQRFRRYKSWHPKPNKEYDDFTLRHNRPSGHATELEKLEQAMNDGGFIATWYAYGHVNEQDTEFVKFRIIRFPLLLEAITNGNISILEEKNNHDGSSSFICIPFSKMPANIFLVNYTPNCQLKMFEDF